MSRIEEIEKELTALLRERERLTLAEESPWPREFFVYIHQDDLWEQDSFRDFIRDAGWEEGSSEVVSLEGCAYEVTLKYLVNRDGDKCFG